MNHKLKKLFFSLLAALAIFYAKGQDTDLQGYSPKVNSFGNYYKQLRADGIHLPHRYGLSRSSTDSTPEIFVWSTPSGDSVVIFVNGRYIVIGANSGGGGGGGGCLGCSADSVRKIRVDTTGMSDTTRYLYYDKASSSYKFRKINLVDVLGALGYAPLAATDTNSLSSRINTKLSSVASGNSVQGNGTSGSPVQLAGDALSPGASRYYGTDGSGAKGYYSLPSGVAPANPTAQVGVTPVNGSATTYMRSDAAPSLDTTGANIHTDGYNVARYKRSVDSTATEGYVTHYQSDTAKANIRAAVDYTNYRSVGGGGHQLWNFSTSGNQSTLTFRQLRDSGDITIVDAGDSGAVLYVAPKMNNYGNAPGQVQFPYASIPAATSYPTGTTLIVPDSGFHYVDTGSGGSRGWKKISGGSSSGAAGIAQIFAKAPLLVSGTDTTYADTSRSSASNSHLVTQNMIRNVHNLEYVDSLNTTTLQNNKLIGAKILQLQIGGITVPTIPTGGTYYTFNESLGQITLQNDSFYANNHIYVLYRAPYVDSLVSTPLIGVIAYMNSFSNINFFHNNSPAAAFSISGTQIVKRNLGAIGMWSFNGDAIDYPLLNTCDEQGYFEFTYRIGSQGSGLGSGIKFGPGNNDGGSGSFNSIYANLNISSLTTPKLYIWNQQVAKDSATFPGTIAVGDSIKIRGTRNKGKFLVKATDLNTSVSVSDSITFNYTYPGNFVIPQSGRWGIAGFGSGIDTIRSLTIGSNSIVNPKVIFIGDSKTTGLYAQSQTNRYGEQVGANPLYQPFAIYADPSDRTYDALGNIEYIIQYVRPKVAFLNIGRNDGMPFSTGSKINYQNIVARLEGYGIRVIHVLPIPEATLNQSTLSTFITSTYGTANTVDPSVGFNTGTMLAADGVHPIGTGNTVIANNIIAAMKIIY